MTASTQRSLVHVALAAMAVLAAAASLAVAALAATATTPQASTPSKSLRSLLSSHELWATVDVCNSPHHPNTVGVRGSMPGDGRAHDRLYMAFRLQYLNTATRVWVDVISGVAPTFIPVGAGTTARQGGTSFQLVAATGKPSVTMRGVVDFQWRRGKKVLQAVARPTSAGHKSLAGADPKNYSAARCRIG
jgi:hypothetical protein